MSSFPTLGGNGEDSQINNCAKLDLVHINIPEYSEFNPNYNYNYPFEYPKGISSVDFILDYYGVEQHKMKMYGGPCCVSEQKEEAGFPCPPGTLHAHFGWLIKHKADISQQTK